MYHARARQKEAVVKHLLCMIVVIGVMGASACTHSPRLARSEEEVANYRSEYLRNNPNGKFNEQILKGEVTKGMDVFQVLASWGLPHLRRGSKNSDLESWVYYSLDDHTQHVISYELVFQTNTLSRWVVDNNAQGLGTLTPHDLIGIPTKGESPANRDLGSADSGTLKKKP